MFQQLQLQDKIYLDLGLLDLEEVVNKTGCLRPCQYTEYSLPSSPEQTTYYNESHLFLILARKTATKRTEVLLYPGTSFVSELGGSLGLFVGRVVHLDVEVRSEEFRAWRPTIPYAIKNRWVLAFQSP